MQKRYDSNTYNTGDVNLASAMMAMGIPLEQQAPCKRILSDKGETYYRFHLCQNSVDGRVNAGGLSRQWGGAREASNPEFAAIINFIKYSRARGARSPEDYLDAAIDHLREIGYDTTTTPANVPAIAAFVNARPNAIESYIYATVANRHVCFEHIKLGRQSIMMHNGDSRASIDVDLPQKLQNELLARLEG